VTIIRVWVEMMGSPRCGIVGKLQSVLMIKPIIVTRTRRLAPWQLRRTLRRAWRRQSQRGARVSRFCVCIGSPCLRQCVHGASVGGAVVAVEPPGPSPPPPAGFWAGLHVVLVDRGWRHRSQVSRALPSPMRIYYD
jgi:hypothetical protein